MSSGSIPEHPCLKEHSHCAYFSMISGIYVYEDGSTYIASGDQNKVASVRALVSN